MKATGGTILVVEDEKDMAEGLRYNLELEGYAVLLAHDGPEGLRRAQEEACSLVLLDLMLPGMPGLDVLLKLRESGVRAPVIILTARGQDHEKVSGLELGADDYVTKPFGLAELLARIRAVLRRSRQNERTLSEVFEFPGVKVDLRRYVVERDGVEHPLSRFEAEILRLLIARSGEVVTRRELLSKVWGYRYLPTTRTVDNHISRIRKKLESEPDNPRYILTAHGIGYRFVLPGQEPAERPAG